MDLTFHGPMQSCSFQHLDCTFTTKRIHNWASFPLGPFFLQLLVLALHSSPVAYWTPSNLGGSSSGVISFCIFVVFMGFSWQECWSGLPSPVDHDLSKLFTITCPSWVALHGMAHSFVELHKPLCHHQALIHEGGPKWERNPKKRGCMCTYSWLPLLYGRH